VFVRDVVPNTQQLLQPVCLCSLQVQGVPRRDGCKGGGAVHGGAEGVAAALVGQGSVPLGAPAVRGQRQP
jgi:hypothetical protein